MTIRLATLGLVVACAVSAPGSAIGQDGSGTPAPVGAAAAKAVVAWPVRDASPRIDGVLDDAAWSRAQPATSFVQHRPEPGAPASRRTEARVAYDEDAIYVGMRLYDDPDSVVARLARRDASGVFTDWAHVMIDSYNDRRTAFRFSVSPRGTKKDVLHFDDTREDLNWDAVWEAAARIDEEGWTAEFRIPLSQLRFSAKDGAALEWGINFGREIARYGEWLWWSPVLPTVSGLVSRSGVLRGLEGLDAGRRLEVLPYTVGGLTRAPADPANPFYDASDPTGNVGVDLRYGVTSNLTLSATINPDFGQVEADASVVNLSAFETFFPEKRPFFVEGSNFFEFDIGYDDGSGESLFYSRRIGRAPQRSVSVEDGHVDRPDATTILGAAKLSGKTSSGWTIGLLNAVTAEETARLAGPDGERWEEPVEPLTSYTVGSLARDFRRGRSSVGMLFTATHRRLGDDGRFDLLRSAAYALGVRGRHRFANDTWEASGFVGGSNIRGGEAAIERVQRGAGHYFQRPDAEHVELDPTRTSLGGAIANLWVGTIGGGNVGGGFGGHLRTPGLELNDLGFQQGVDEALVFGNIRYNQYEPKWIFRNFNIGLNPSAAWTTGGEHTWLQIGHWANWELRNFWRGGWWIGRRFSALAVDALRGGPAVRRNESIQSSAWLDTDRRRPVMLGLSFNGGREFHDSGRWDYSIGADLTVRPSPRLNFSLGPSYRRNHNTWQYVGQLETTAGGRESVVGELDQTTVSLTTRVNLTISPTLSLELYAQPYISGGEYEGFRRVADPRAVAFDERFQPLDAAYDAAADAFVADLDGDDAADITFGNPDFSFKEMRGNAVLRWEYRPGSTIYLVWSQSRTASLNGAAAASAFDLGRDAGRLFNQDEDFLTPVTNVFILKASYWLNP